ncbi:MULTISPECIES: hypothetical protein [Pseudomonas]|uniref:Restriction endonuclease n=1 Tax=Pseudomonas helleri TaxID=1608996 RepID=A0A7X1WVT6_9PSED|nr:hypothetical protein [Pseudomonas helleri]MQT75627.1 hypothetical protein [Pseudomonas helleri]
MAQSELQRIEAEIDDAFANNALAKLPFAQSAWTLLSVVEDHNFKITVVSPLEENLAAIFVDGLMNALAYPLRACYQSSVKGSAPFKRELVDEHYELAYKWLEASKDYVHFCSIFSLYHANEIELHVKGHNLVPSDWSNHDLSYEAYNRFVAKRDPEYEPILRPNLILRQLKACMRVSGGVYSVDFTRRLMDELTTAFQDTFKSRHTLPENWQFTRFSLADYRKVFTSLQSMAATWFLARQLVAADGAPALAFASALWTPRRGVLVATLARHTGLKKAVVTDVLQYLTFGEMGIRKPDIAIQPIVDLTNGQYAVSPFVMAHVHAERNLCVLLNQIPNERQRYLQLVEEKEQQVRSETIASLSELGLDFKYGQLADTDIDLAIIDRKAKQCLCVEIKWFIEPAEIREVLAKTEELIKGTAQARKISKAFLENNNRLMSLLDIDQSYDFLTIVGSVNFIGGHRAQHPDVPITKLWHLASEIRKRGGLDGVLEWLRSRSYLPRRGQEYKAREILIQCGEWHSTWYGIGYV